MKGKEAQADRCRKALAGDSPSDHIMLLKAFKVISDTGTCLMIIADFKNFIFTIFVVGRVRILLNEIHKETENNQIRLGIYHI